MALDKSTKSLNKSGPSPTLDKKSGLKLHANLLSPYARKCFIVAHELGLAVELVDVGDATSGPQPWKTSVEIDNLNPTGRYPILVTQEHGPMYGSSVICQYFDEQAGGNRLYSARHRWDELINEATVDQALDSALLVTYETHFRPGQFRWNDWAEGHRSKVRRVLAVYEEGRKELAYPFHMYSGSLTLGGCALAALLWYLTERQVIDDWQENHPKLVKWYKEISKRPAFRRMNKDVYKTI